MLRAECAFPPTCYSGHCALSSNAPLVSTERCLAASYDPAPNNGSIVTRDSFCYVLNYLICPILTCNI